MKNTYFLSIAFLLLSGCGGFNGNSQSYSSDNLRAPVYQPYQQAQKASESSLPQSVTQPLNINPIPADGANNSVVNTPAVVPQQPLVQTIVIPQYTPQPLPYTQASYAVPPVMPMQVAGNLQQGAVSTPVPQVPVNVGMSSGSQTVTIPAQQALRGGAQAPIMQNSGSQTQIQIPGAPINVPETPVKGSDFLNAQNGSVISEDVYPSWAASDFKTPASGVKEGGTVYFKNPNRNETVQCESVDVMCIASYQQQGYIRTNGFNEVTPVAPRSPQKSGGYPQTDWDDEIPRW